MSKVNLIPNIVDSLQATQSQEKKYEIVKKYEKETLFKRIVLFAYNPWINFKLQHFVPKHMGKKFGMGMSRFMHMFDEIIEGQLDPKDAEFGFNMAFLHINLEEASILLGIINQSLDLGLEIETINKVWPDSISSYPLRTAKVESYKNFDKFPASIQTVSKGLRINIIISDNTVQYRQKDGSVIEGWDHWNEQFINLAQGQNTVFDGHAVIAKDNKISETDNAKVLEADVEDIRFIFWDVIRYDGFIVGKDTRIGYNWRYNGLEHMMMLAYAKNPQPCYDILKAEMVGSKEQLDTAIKNYSKAVIKSLEDTWTTGESDGEIISFQK
jgi:hypothetical protein